MFISEQSQKWSQIIKEELGVTDSKKLGWMAQYARNHEVFEGLQAASTSTNVNAMPLNTTGMGNPMTPVGMGFNYGDHQGAGHGFGVGNTGSDFHNPLYQTGSGDVPFSTLTMSLEVAAQTIGMELVPVIPANGPFAMLQYFDTPYAGGKLGDINQTLRDGLGKDNKNKPIYVKFVGEMADADRKELLVHEKTGANLKASAVDIVGNGKTVHGHVIGRSRIDGGIIVQVIHATDADVAIADLFDDGKNAVTIGGKNMTNARVDLVAGMADHVQGFSNFFDGSDEPMTRAQNETGVGNTIGARFFSKMVQMGSYEVTGSVTRQQLQDMPLYGIDVVGKVLEAMQNELSQAINNRILDRVFKLGVTNAKTQRDIQGLDLNLYFGNAGAAATKDITTFIAYHKMIDIHNKHIVENAGTWLVKNATQNTAAENFMTAQRRIASRILAARNVVANVSRYGMANWVVTNTQILTALQDNAQFVTAPMINSLDQDGSSSIYYAGSIAGLKLYVDPNMAWEDTRVLVGRKSDGQTPGVVFMPYILMDTVQTVAEGTMAPKLLVNSRFAIVDAGFHPEQNYFCFAVESEDAFLI